MGRRWHCILEISRSSSFFNCSDGQSHEGNKSYGCHEGNEGHEEEGREQDCKGPLCQVCRLPWIQGEDRRRFDQGRFGEEQEWKDCEQEGFGTWQEGLRQHQGLDYGRAKGQEGSWSEGLRRCQEGQSSL